MKKFTHSKSRFIGLIAVLAVIGGLGGFGAYYFLQYSKVVKNPDILSKQETKAIESAVKQHLELPNDEAPTLATVQDKDKLKDQPFFSGAQNGDKILIYTKAKKAIVYRQRDDRIINVGPILLDQSQLKANVKLLNGGKNQDKFNQAETVVNEQFTDLSIIAKKDQAVKSDYAKIIVADVKGSFTELAKSLADKLGGEVGSLPAGEIADDSVDIIIITAK